MQVPLAVIGGHSKAVSYVRWLDGTHLVSASTDNQLKLWDLAATGRHMRQQDWGPRTVLTGADFSHTDNSLAIPQKPGFME